MRSASLGHTGRFQTNYSRALTGMQPLHLTAKVNDAVYHRVKKEKSRGTIVRRKTIATWRQQEHTKTTSSWRTALLASRARQRPFLNAILNHWEEWIPGGPPNLSYRVTQMLTGHGCFADYLKKIGATSCDICTECGVYPDCATHLNVLLS